MFRKCSKYNQKLLFIYCVAVLLLFVDPLLSFSALPGKFEEPENFQNQFGPGANIYTRSNLEICLPGIVSPSVLPPQYEDCGRHLKESFHNGHPDQNKDTPELLKTYGYPFEVHQVKTKDLYVLTLFRIVGSPKLGPYSMRHKQPVLLNHGIMASSEWWFFVPPHKSLPLMLADAGYDVWLNNARGTTYSLEHEVYNSTKDLRYWEYSFHELGIYDVPAIIGLILGNSQHEKLFYIGHSMGTTQLFVSLAEIPEMNNKIKAAFLLSPVAIMGHATNVLRYILAHLKNPEAHKATNIAVQGRLDGPQFVETFKVSLGDVCAFTALKCGVCDNAWFALFGFNAPQTNYTEMPHIYSRFLNSQSLKSFTHYVHLISTCKFVKFDYEPNENLFRYGTIFPPEYNLTNINVPLYMFYAQQDNFAIPMDVEQLAREFRPGVVKVLHKVKDDLFNHVDFQLAMDVDKLLYHPILTYMEQYL